MEGCCCAKPVANMISFDIEGFIESWEDVMTIPPQYLSETEQTREIEANTLKIVELMADVNQKATFFILGRIARDMPRLVKTIADAGHEIACHSFTHRRLYNFTAAEVETFVRDAKRRLEDAGGKPVYGFRAPDFSITNKNPWCFDALRQAGFLYDSSVYPTGLHDVYGISGFPTKPFRMANGLISVPMSIVDVFGRQLPFGGGGYLRLYPLWLTKRFFRRLNREGTPGVVYCHPYEAGDVVPWIREMRPLRKFRTYIGRRGVKRKLRKLVRAFRFMPIKEYLDTYLDPQTGGVHEQQ